MRKFRGRLVALISLGSLALGVTYAGGAVSKPTVTTPHIRGIVGKQIVVGGDGTETISGAPAQVNLGIGAQARFYWQNKMGGVDGYKFKYIGTLDDGGQQSTEVGNLTKLVSEGVYSLTPYFSFAPSDNSFFSQNELPSFAFPLTPLLCSSPWVFGLGGCLVPTTWKESTALVGLAEFVDGRVVNPKTGVIKVPKGTTFANIEQSASSTATELQTIQAAAKSEGFTVCDMDGTVPESGTTDYSAFAARMMSDCNHGKGPGAILNQLQTPTAVSGFQSAIKALGWKGKTELVFYQPAALQSPSIADPLNGDAVYLDVVQFPELGGAEFKEFREALKAIGDGDVPINSAMMDSWGSADMLIDAMRYAGVKNWAPAKLDAVLQHWTYPGVPDYTVPTTFPRGHLVPDPCTSVDVVNGNHYKGLYPLACGRDVNVSTGAIYPVIFKV